MQDPVQAFKRSSVQANAQVTVCPDCPICSTLARCSPVAPTSSENRARAASQRTCGKSLPMLALHGVSIMNRILRTMQRCQYGRCRSAPGRIVLYATCPLSTCATSQWAIARFGSRGCPLYSHHVTKQKRGALSARRCGACVLIEDTLLTGDLNRTTWKGGETPPPEAVRYEHDASKMRQSPRKGASRRNDRTHPVRAM